MGDCLKIHFWEDTWCGDLPFHFYFFLITKELAKPLGLSMGI